MITQDPDAPIRIYYDHDRQECIIPVDLSIALVAFIPSMLIIPFFLFLAWRSWSVLLRERGRISKRHHVKLQLSYLSTANMLSTMAAGLLGMIQSHPVLGLAYRYVSLCDILLTCALNAIVLVRIERYRRRQSRPGGLDLSSGGVTPRGRLSAFVDVLRQSQRKIQIHPSTPRTSTKAMPSETILLR